MDLIGLVHQQVAACSTSKQVNLQVVCDNLTLNTRASTALGRVLRKLTNSATKHGALSCSAGKVLIVFDQVERVGELVELRMQWMETNGPLLAPHLVSGMGNGALARMLCQETNGRLTIEYQQGGICCSVNMQLGYNSTQSLIQTDKRCIKVFIYEECALVALDMMDHFIAEGFEVVGPTACATEALPMVKSMKADFALIDIDSHSDAVWRLANELTMHGIPFAYTSKVLNTQTLPDQYPKAEVLSKPYQYEQICTMTGRLSLRANSKQ